MELTYSIIISVIAIVLAITCGILLFFYVLRKEETPPEPKEKKPTPGKKQVLVPGRGYPEIPAKRRRPKVWSDEELYKIELDSKK